ncbi:MAG: ComF family protein [Halanaerobiales bacterium]
MSLLGKLLAVIYPSGNLCLSCKNNYIHSEIKGICDSCLKEIELLEKYCQYCGRDIGTVESDQVLCKYCLDKGYRFEMARSSGTYEGLLKKLLLNFKYNQQTELKRALGHLLYISLKSYYILEEIDRIVPVPIHDKRLKQRGYNQAELLAEELSNCTGIPLSTGLKRIKNIPPLYNFAYEQRRTLLKDTFYIEPNFYQGDSLLLIDDIFTTGATCNEIAGLLKEIAGAVRVLVLTVATARTY